MLFILQDLLNKQHAYVLTKRTDRIHVSVGIVFIWDVFFINGWTSNTLLNLRLILI